MNNKSLKNLKEQSSFTKNVHPCLKCGACCASFRVAFYWREIEGVLDHNEKLQWMVPEHLTVDLDGFLKCMQGTEKKHSPRCTALNGRIGEITQCSIYWHRPTPCRSFKASYENGKQNVRCDEARQKHGLKPLRREDWHNPISDLKLELKMNNN